jgi:hypothetical protein
VAAEPGAGRAAADRGALRATQTERERMIDALQAAYVQDRLTKDEFDERVGQVLISRTYADLAALTADIPVGPAVARPPRGQPPRRMSGAAGWGTSGLVTPAVLAVGFTAVSLHGGRGFGVVAFVVAIAYFLYWLNAGADMLWQWHSMGIAGAGMCVRCAHTAASHRRPDSCTARPGGAPGPWRHCACPGYVPPGVAAKRVGQPA